MLCALSEGQDDFFFESRGVNLASIKDQSSFKFSAQKTIADFDHQQAIGQYEKTITLAGKLIQYDNQALNLLHQIAERKKPVILAFDDGRARKVLIQGINSNKSAFLKDGKFLKQEFEVALTVIGGEENGTT